MLKAIEKRIRPGISETELAHYIEGLMSKRGLKKSFKTIVACGKNTAHPHAKPGSGKIRSNDMVMVDFGVIYKGYHSDLTRTFKIGKPPKKLCSIYSIVEKAQKKAIKMIRHGISINDVSAAVHDYMRKSGCARYIKHTLGHGIGKRIHEPPKISEKNRRIFKKNMVCTIEPGLYIDGIGGARIEDMVLVGSNRCKVLTK